MSIAVNEQEADEAEDQINNWIESEPDSALAHYWLGVLYNFQGDYEEAAEILSEAKEVIERLAVDKRSGRIMPIG